MKSLQQIKKELHEYIDGISDETELMVIYENTLKYLKSDSGKDKTSENDPIPNYQQERLDEAINHGSSDENKRQKELKKSIGRWFSDGGKNSCWIKDFHKSFAGVPGLNTIDITDNYHIIGYLFLIGKLKRNVVPMPHVGMNIRWV